jgi:pimeloyl-[acyl-carrier protein] methyl ester esterase
MTKIHAETFGNGQPLVLVHGWAMHSGIWREFAKQLARSYRVTCIDLPGHGRSDPIESFTLERISNALVNAVPEQRCCWLGWSLGATVAIDVASRYPERVSSLILLAGNPLFIVEAAETQSQWSGVAVDLLDDFAGQLNKNCRATLLRFLSLQVNGLPEQKNLLKMLKAAVFECEAPDTKTLQGGLNILKQADLRPALSGLATPVSAILGGLDTLVPVAVGQKLQQVLPDLELNIIDRAGHVPFLSHSEETRSIISRFMDKQCN